MAISAASGARLRLPGGLLAQQQLPSRYRHLFAGVQRREFSEILEEAGSEFQTRKNSAQLVRGSIAGARINPSYFLR
ncbi:MAG: hypothetical protein VXZ38_09685 [Planctomycetota bacterium]|nr:hypothetical protein [Planctomycetota bacterium]